MGPAVQKAIEKHEEIALIALSNPCNQVAAKEQEILTVLYLVPAVLPLVLTVWYCFPGAGGGERAGGGIAPVGHLLDPQRDADHQVCVSIVFFLFFGDLYENLPETVGPVAPKIVEMHEETALNALSYPRNQVAAKEQEVGSLQSAISFIRNETQTTKSILAQVPPPYHTT